MAACRRVSLYISTAMVGEAERGSCEFDSRRPHQQSVIWLKDLQRTFAIALKPPQQPRLGSVTEPVVTGSSTQGTKRAPLRSRPVGLLLSGVDDLLLASNYGIVVGASLLLTIGSLRPPAGIGRAPQCLTGLLLGRNSANILKLGAIQRQRLVRPGKISSFRRKRGRWKPRFACRGFCLSSGR